MSGSIQAFAPGPTVTLDVADVSVSAPLDANAPGLRLLNAGPDLVFIRIGTGALTATLADFPIPVGVPVSLTKGVGANTIAAIAETLGPTLLYVTTGIGH